MPSRNWVGPFMLVVAGASVPSWACGSAQSSNGNAFDGGGGTAGGQEGGGQGGGAQGGSSGGAPSFGSGAGPDASSAGSGGGKCVIGTLGVPGTWGQGDVFATWLASQGESASGNLGDQVLTPALLGPFNVIVSQDVHSNHVYSAAEVSALQDWITAGGGFVTLIGYSTPPEPTNVNLLLAPFDMSYDDTPILAGKGSTVPITSWVHPHPVTQGITEVGIDNGYAVAGSGTVLASEQGHQVLEVKSVGSGHVVVWGDEWITYDIEWVSNPQYQVQQFWQNIVDWVDPGGGCKVPTPTVQ